MKLLILLSSAPLILVAVAMIVLANGQRRASHAQVEALRLFAERIAMLGRSDG